MMMMMSGGGGGGDDAWFLPTPLKGALIPIGRSQDEALVGTGDELWVRVSELGETAVEEEEEK